MYAVFGTSNCLALGPVAIVSLLVAALVNKYNIEYLVEPEKAINLAAEASLACGLILTVMGLLNLGSFIRFLSHPVISGFTSAAACLIGLSQLKSAFGFPSVVPQIGSVGGVEYNYEQMQWYIKNWNGRTTPTAKAPYSILYRNHFAAKVGACINNMNPYIRFLRYKLQSLILSILFASRTLSIAVLRSLHTTSDRVDHQEQHEGGTFS